MTHCVDLAVVEVDEVMVVDSIAQSFIERMERDLAATPKYPERVSIVVDHVAPASTVSVAQAQKEAREYAAKTGVRLFDVGRGICHQVLMEEGLAKPGWIVLGSDSHSTTYGAVAAFGSGMGATDIALAAAFLASDDASFITGAELVIDGGMNAGAVPRRQ